MVGESIGNYRIVAKLGEGGMGAVYRGEHRRIARQVAIKVLLPELSNNQDVVSRFFNEARATSLIRHPGIVEITDCDLLADGRAYIVMEFLEGESLGSHLRRNGRFPAARALSLARHIADALAAAHAQGIVHRDLKPDNVFLLSAAGAAAQPIKILDFGIAKLMHPDAGQHHKTRTGSIMGTPAYMSPEQCRGVGTVDHRTDIYSLGVILFELLCGRPPFESEGFGELIQAHLGLPPPAVRSLDPALPPAVDALVARMLAKAPGDRPQTMDALCAELDAVAAMAAGVAAPALAQAEEPGAVYSGLAGRTMLMPEEAPRPQTTLRSASSEKMAVVDFEPEPARRKARRTAPVVAAVATVAALAGGIAIWRVAGGGASGSASSRPPVAKVAEEAVAPPAPVPAPPPVPAAPAPVAPTPTAAPPAAPEPPAPAAPPAALPAKVRVVIASEPSGAEVCLARDRILLGRTRFEWSPERSSRAAKLMIRKAGYRGQEIAVVPDRDGTRRVKLEKLGPDDMDDLDNCQRK